MSDTVGNKENCTITTHANEFGNMPRNLPGKSHFKARLNDNVGQFPFAHFWLKEPKDDQERLGALVSGTTSKKFTVKYCGATLGSN